MKFAFFNTCVEIDFRYYSERVIYIELWITTVRCNYFFLKIVRKYVKIGTYTSSCLNIKLEFEEVHYE